MQLPKRIKRWIAKQLTAPPESGSWLTIYDSTSGAWQADESLDRQSVLRFAAVYACIRQIAFDVSKLPIKLVQLQDAKRDVWSPTFSPAYSPVLHKPNSYQTRIEFIVSWITSLLLEGNTYVLKRYNGAGRVNSMSVLNPTLVQPLVSPSGAVFYRLSLDWINRLDESEIVVPAREIIHHKYITLNHPLIGNSPLQVAGQQASAGMDISKQVRRFFQNNARPSGVLTAPEDISDEQANRIAKRWQEYQKPENQGKIAVLEQGLTFKSIALSATDAQLLEAWRFTRDDICVAFGVPAWKVGVAPIPSTAGNAETSQTHYYQTTLQPVIEAMELLLDEALSLPTTMGIEFDLMNLLRADTPSRFKTWKDGITGGFMEPNRARAYEGWESVEGGDSPLMQQQNYSLAALAKRDAKEDPFAKGSPAPQQQQPAPATDGGDDNEDVADEEVTAALETLISERLERT